MSARKTCFAFLLACSILSSCRANAAVLSPSALRDGSIVVALTGRIERNDGSKFRGLVQAANQSGARVNFLVLNSPGGDVYGGADIALTVRKNQIDTIVADGSLCASSCFMVFVAGIRKHYASNSRIGVHSAVNLHYGENADAKSTTVDMARFLTALGTPPSIVGRMVAMRPDEMAWLDASELSLISGSALFQSQTQTQSSYIATVQPSVQSIPARSVSANDRSEARGLNTEAISLIRSSQASRAVPLLSRAYSISPFDAEIAGNYGYALYLTGAFTQARDVLALALKLRPKRGSTWNNLGLTLSALNQTDWATECFVNYYTFSSRKDIAYRQLVAWESAGSLSLQAAVSNAKRMLGLP